MKKPQIGIKLAKMNKHQFMMTKFRFMGCRSFATQEEAEKWQAKDPERHFLMSRSRAVREFGSIINHYLDHKFDTAKIRKLFLA